MPTATCPKCQHSFDAAPSGAKLACPQCGTAFERRRPAAGTAARATAGRSGSERARPGSARGSSAAAQRKSPLPFVLGGAALVVVALGLWLATRGSAAETSAQAAAPQPLVDLASELPDLPRIEGTEDDVWTSINENVTRYMTDGSQQAGDRLMAQGKRSIPAILNGFKRLDLTKKENVSIGLKTQMMLLQGLCGGTEFGWRRDTRPDDVAFNQAVVRRWFEAWTAAGEDDAIWAEIARTKTIPAAAKK